MNYKNLYISIVLMNILIIIYLVDITLAHEKDWVIYRNIDKEKYDFFIINPVDPNIFYAAQDNNIIRIIKKGKKVDKSLLRSVNCVHINKLVLNPYITNELYICTDNGLYILNISTKKIKAYDQKLNKCNIVDVAFGKDKIKPKYIATNRSIFINDDSIWKEIKLPSTEERKIQAVAVRAIKPDEYILLGTDKGVLICSIIEDTLTIVECDCKDKSILDFATNFIRQKRNYLITDKRQIYFEKDDGGLIYWDKIKSKSLEKQLESEKFDFYDITLNLKKPYSLLITTSRNDVLLYNLNISKIALFVIDESGKNEIYERAYINISSKLENKISLRSFRNLPNNMTLPSNFFSSDKEGLPAENYGYDFLIFCQFCVDDNAIIINTVICDNKGKRKLMKSYSLGINENKSKMQNKLVNDIIKEIKGRKNGRVIRYALLGGAGLAILAKLIWLSNSKHNGITEKTTETGDNKGFGFPPPFPIPKK